MGIAIAASSGSVVARGRRGGLRPGSFEATDFPDSVPALAAVAAFAPGESRFAGIAHLKLKESDRLAAVSEIVRRAGRDAAEDASGLVIRGSDGARAARTDLPTFGDHRIAMAAALLALRLGGIRIENPDCVAKSYPRFFRDLDSVCGRTESRTKPAS
jgi:3-phosphoshikimate 1-carboxyvinyltransferase